MCWTVSAYFEQAEVGKRLFISSILRFFDYRQFEEPRELEQWVKVLLSKIVKWLLAPLSVYKCFHIHQT
jgi:hypothetical protein